MLSRSGTVVRQKDPERAAIGHTPDVSRRLGDAILFRHLDVQGRFT